VIGYPKTVETLQADSSIKNKFCYNYRAAFIIQASQVVEIYKIEAQYNTAVTAGTVSNSDQGHHSRLLLFRLLSNSPVVPCDWASSNPHSPDVRRLDPQ
jgi:hypothetical protein